MTTNAFCMSRLRGLGFSLKTVYSRAMSSDLLPSIAYGNDGSCTHTFAPLTIVAQGISVPVSRGGPPIFNK